MSRFKFRTHVSEGSEYTAAARGSPNLVLRAVRVVPGQK